MTRTIVSVTGYGGTGSSAVTDLLSEFDSVYSPGDIEIWLLQDYNSISDLEYYLIDGNHRSKVSIAIDRFKDYLKINSNYYSSIFGNSFDEISNSYIASLVDVSFPKAISKYEVSNAFLRFCIFYLSIRIQYLIGKLKNPNLDVKEFAPWIPKFIKCYSVPDRERFYKLTKKFTDELFNQFNTDADHIVLDQLTPAMSINRYNNYIDYLKVIVVDRDPRDLFLLNELHWKGASYVCDTSNVQTFIRWYKTMRSSINNEKSLHNVLHVNFEDLIYNYEEAKLSICNFLNIPISNHKYNKKFFNPDVSRQWTRLWLHPHSYKNEINQISEHLNEYCQN